MIEINNEKLQGEIKKIVSKIIEVSPEQINIDTHFVEELGADSMMALEIMAVLEKTYKIDIPEGDLPKLATLRQITELMQKLLST